MGLPFKIKKAFFPRTKVINRTITQTGESSGLELGETDETAYRGDRGKTAYDHSQLASGNPHGVTKTDVGLGNVPNTDCTTTANITDSSNKRFITDAQQTVLGNTSGTNTGDETGSRIATLLHASTNKSALVDADEVNGTDSANGFSLIRTTWTQVKAFLKTYFDTLYASLAGATFTGTVVVPIVRNSSVTLNTGGGAQTIITGASGGVYLFVAYDTGNDSTVSIAYGVGAGSTITELADSASVYTWAVSGSNFQVAAGGRTVQVTVLRLN